MERNNEMFVHGLGLACLAIVLMIEATYILQFATDNVTIDPKQFDIMLMVFSVAAIAVGVLACYFKQYDLASLLIIIGVAEFMFGCVEYVEGSIQTITFLDYILVAVMAVAVIVFVLKKSFGLSLLALLCGLMFFSFKLSNMFGADAHTENWCVVAFGFIAGIWALFLILIKFLEFEGFIGCRRPVTVKPVAKSAPKTVAKKKSKARKSKA